MGDGPLVNPVRRVVTGHNHSGLSRVLLDSNATNVKKTGANVVATTLWATSETPADVVVGPEIEDRGNKQGGFAPALHGSRFVVVDFLPGNPPFVHRTDTLDYAVVISGSIVMHLDEMSVELAAGDVLIQRATSHAWENQSDAVARVAFVLIDANALGIGNPLPKAPSESDSISSS